MSQSNPGLAAVLYRGGEVVSPSGVLKAWAAWLRSGEDAEALGWPSSTIEHRLKTWGCGTSGAAELTAPEMVVQGMQHAQVLGLWCALILKDCDYLQRRAVRHHYVDGMSFGAIAEQLGGRPVPGVEAMTADEARKAVGAVQDRLRRAIAMQVKGLCFTDDGRPYLIRAEIVDKPVRMVPEPILRLVEEPGRHPRRVFRFPLLKLQRK